MKNMVFGVVFIVGAIATFIFFFSSSHLNLTIKNVSGSKLNSVQAVVCGKKSEVFDLEAGQSHELKMKYSCEGGVQLLAQDNNLGSCLYIDGKTLKAQIDLTGVKIEETDCRIAD